MNHTTIELAHKPGDELRRRHQLLKAQKPDIRPRDAADELGVSEGELLASRIGTGVIRLQDTPQAILSAILPLGEVMALTRNNSAVHERNGVYDNVSFSSHGNMTMGLAINPDIDLRLFMDHWKFCFAVKEESHKHSRKSLQFFDKSGMAVHKIYLTPKSNGKAYDDLVANFKAPGQPGHIETEAYTAENFDLPDHEVNWPGFRQAWESLRDTHDFYPMLRKFRIGREQAFRKIGHKFAYEVRGNSLQHALEAARDRECPIMVFVGNRGCIQIHSGPVKELAQHGPWFNVLDQRFNLHVRVDMIASSWVTKKPTDDGVVTALELFDRNGEVILTLFGMRKPGVPELVEWRGIVEGLTPQGVRQ